MSTATGSATEAILAVVDVTVERVLGLASVAQRALQGLPIRFVAVAVEVAGPLRFASCDEHSPDSLSNEP
jgi:hypothetical protein